MGAAAAGLAVRVGAGRARQHERQARGLHHRWRTIPRLPSNTSLIMLNGSSLLGDSLLIHLHGHQGGEFNLQ